MKVKSLQIGDYVNYRGQIIKVTSLYGKGGSNEVGWSTKECVWVNADNVEPIPLTQEILEKNGYKKDGYIYRHEELGRMQLGELFEDASIDFDKNGINYRIQTSPRFLQYVHQLQHALRLCGIEKEIIL